MSYSDKVYPGNWRRGSPNDYLLKDAKFDSYYQNLRKSSVDTANERKKRFGRLHQMYGKLPADFVALGVNGATEFLRKMVDDMEKGVFLTEDGKKFKPNYIRNFKKAVLSWLKENGIEITASINVTSGDDDDSGDKAIPKPQHVQQVLNGQIDLRQKTCVSLMAFAGLREHVIGSAEGTNGLTIKDFPEMKIKNAYTKDEKGKLVKVGEAKVTFDPGCIPTRIVIRESISKIGKKYQTFLNQPGCDAVAQYLERRMNEKTVRTAEGEHKTKPGEILTPDSPIVTAERLSIGRFMRRNQISGIIKDAITAAGFTFNPYLLRNFFIDAMESAERHDIIKVTDDRLFWSGETPSMQATYTKFNKRIDPDKLTEMRQIYQQASDQYLTPQRATYIPLEQAGNELKRLYLTEYGKMNDEEIRQLGDLTNYTFPQLAEIVEKRRKKAATPKATSKMKLQEQVMVANGKADEIQRYLKKGYTFADKQFVPKHVILELPAET